MKFLKKFWPPLFIILVWFIFSSPYFLFGKVPYSSTYQVNFFPPWASYEKFHGPVKNNAMPDIATQIYPWKKFTIDTLRMGQIPLWNPYNFSGNPHLANYQSAVLSPFNALFFVFSFIDAWSILILLQPLLAGIFMYLMLRSFARLKVASVIGSVTFMFCGFMVVWMAYGTLSYAILYLPLAIYACQRFIQTNNKLFLGLLTVSIPLSFFSGHFQVSLYFLLTTIAFVIFKFFENRRAMWLLFSILVGLAISLIQILPSLVLYENAVRSLNFIKSETIPFQYLSTIFAPDFFGNPVTRNDWFGHYAEWASFIGIVPFILAFFAFAKRNKEIVFFVSLVAISLILAIDSPLSAVIVSLKIPVISTSSLSRVIVLFSFAMAVLSAFGIDNFLELVKKKNYNRILKIFLIPLSLILFFIVLPIVVNVPSDKLFIAVKSLRVPFALLAVLIVLIVVNSKVKKINLLAFSILLLVFIQSAYFAYKWMPFDPKNFVFPALPIIDAIKKEIGYGRLFGNFGAEISSYYGIPSIEGYDPLFIKRYGEFVQSADYGSFVDAQRSVVKISRRGEQMSRALDLLGVNLILHPLGDTNQNWAFPVWEDQERFSVVFQDDKFQIYKNNTSLERAALFYDYELIENNKEIIKRFYSPEFDFRNKLILELDPEIKTTAGSGESQIQSYTPNEVIIKVKSSAPALLFLSDNYYPGWSAKVNGKETKILRADYTFRAVVVPAGESTVLFSFEPGL